MLLCLQARALKNQTNTLATQAADLKFKVQGAKQRASTLRGLVVEVRVSARSENEHLVKGPLVMPKGAPRDLLNLGAAEISRPCT